MFVMMNSARLDVGTQGVGVAERAFQHALAYALDRRQGRAPGVRDGDMIAIMDHPDVRRTLYVMRALTDAARGICYANAVAFDLSKTASDEGVRRENAVREALLTPIAKAWATDRANEITSMGVQVHGGMGYVEETGAAQFVRDVRVAAIYEGTNGIQAIDLVGRKLLADGGDGIRAFIHEMTEFGENHRAHDNAALREAAEKLDDGLKALTASTDWLLQNGAETMDDALAGASPYLKQFGNIAGGYYLMRGVAGLIADGADPDLIAAKATILGTYADNFLSEAVSLTPAVTAGAASLNPVTPSLLGRLGRQPPRSLVRRHPRNGCPGYPSGIRATENPEKGVDPIRFFANRSGSVSCVD